MSTDPEPKAVQVSTTSDGITTITIDREHRRNAVDPRTARKLYDAVLAFEADDAQKVLILYGSHGTFCAGFDLHSLAQSNEDKSNDVQDVKGEVTPDQRQSDVEPVRGRNFGPMGPSRLQIKKPVISAVAGYAVAGGLELSLIGDMRIAEKSAVFGVFCRRWGVPLIDGGTVRLQAVVGLGRAMDMILTGRPVSADEALSMGLANRVVEDGKALEAATEIAKQLVTFPQLCMNLDRTSCYYAAYQASSFEDALGYEYDNGKNVINAESISGAKRFSSGEGRHGSFEAFGKGRL